MCWRLLTPLLAVMVLTGCASPPPSAEPSTGLPSPAQSTAVLVPTDSDAGVLRAPADTDETERTAWLTRLDRTVEALPTADLGPLDDQWDGRLIVELPATATDYAALAGADSAEAAAVTRCSDGQSSITINPQVRAENPGYLDSLLLHEAVHSATSAACTEAPLWIEEGLAEWFTAQHDPATQQANQQWLQHQLDAGLPTGLPPDAAFTGSAAQLSGAYALALFAVATAVEHLGQDAAMAYFAAPDEKTTDRITDWYLDGLQAARTAVPASASGP